MTSWLRFGHDDTIAICFIWAEEVNKGRARVLVLEARATGNTGKPEGALKVAMSAWETYPGSEPAREVARWLGKLYPACAPWP